ncbi:unnamed protein product, partial [Owenia fusiformis]
KTKAAVAAAVAKSTAAGSTTAAPSGDAAQEVKKVMNQVFHSVKTEFKPDQTFTGQQVVQSILQTIKETTLRLTQQKDTEEQEEEESEEEESEEEEEEDKKVPEKIVPVKVEAVRAVQSSAAPKVVEDVIEAPVTMVTTSSTGGRGNPMYAAELQRAAEEASKLKETEVKVTAEKPLEQPVMVEEVIEAPMTVASGYSTGGGGGNPYYAAKLDKAREDSIPSPESIESTSAKPDIVEEPIAAPVVASSTSAPKIENIEPPMIVKDS